MSTKSSKDKQDAKNSAKQQRRLNAKSNKILDIKGKTEMEKVRSHIQTLVPKGDALVESIAMSIACPGSEPLRRWPSEYSTKKTAIATPFSKINATWGQAGGTGAMIGRSEFLALSFQNDVRKTIHYDQNTAALIMKYIAQLSSYTNPFPGPIQTYSLPIDEALDLDPASYLAANTYQPHGPVLFCGSVKGGTERYVWLNAGDALSLTATLANLVSVDVQLWRYDAYGLQPQAVTVNIVGTGASQVSVIRAAGVVSGGYYAIKLINRDVAVQSIAITELSITGSSAVFCHLPIPSLVSNLTSVEGVRILGSSLMYTTTASELNATGQCAMMQTGRDEHWMKFILPLGIVDYIGQAKDSKTMKLANGMYGFLKATSPSDFEPIDSYHISPAGQLIDCDYDISECGSYVVFAAQCSVAAGCSGYLSTNVNVEYLTSDTFRDTDFAFTSPEPYRQALNIIRFLDQFHENPLHIGELWTNIKKAVGSVSKFIIDNGPTIVKAVQLVSRII